MATESVATERRTPGIADLLIDTLAHMEDPAAIEKATGNVLTTVNAGLESIGRMLWLSCNNDDWFDAKEHRRTVADAACLIQLLAETASWMQTMNSNAKYDLAHSDKGEPA